MLTTLIAMLVAAAPPDPLPPLPSPPQLAWQEMETNAFVHFGPNTFTNLEWGGGKEDPNLFNPTNLDCRQWTRTFRKAGFKGVIVTAKHHDGFCLWPSKLSTHTVAQSSWKDGKGDVLRELSDACHAEGLKFGVYLSPWDRNHPAYGTPEYNQVFNSMLEEVLSHYGSVFEVWFDGANGEGPNGKKQVYDWPLFYSTVRRLQPKAVIFGDGGPDIRWVGNEDGSASETSWAMIPDNRYTPGTSLSSELGVGNMSGDRYAPPECDVSIRPGWFYHAEEESKVKTPLELLNLYERSVGRNGLLLLNVPPNREGRLSDNECTSLLGFKKLLDNTYGENLAQGARAEADVTRDGSSPDNAMSTGSKYWAAPDGIVHATLGFELPRPQRFDRVMLQEQISLGQRISGFDIYALSDGQWRRIYEGTTVGYKRIVPVKPIEAVRIRIEILDARACPTLKGFGLYASPGIGG